MNANQSATMYESIPVVSELNKVQGFDPLKFLRRTSKGERKLDLKYKKLWFRLKYPNGRIKLSALKITDQLAIIEARVYFDKNDTQPKSSFIAQRDANSTPGGLYIESAQHAAIDQALSDAGFGVQFTSAAPNKSAETTAPIVKEQPVVVESTATAEKKPDVKAETVAEVVEETIAEAVTETPVAQPVVTESVVAEETAQVQPAVVDDAPVEEVSAAPASTVVETVVEAVEEAEGEEVEDEAPVAGSAAPAYTSETPVEEICSMMTYEEAGNVIVPIGTCKDWTLAQVADRRPASLKWYINGYTGNDNILRAAAMIMQSTLELQKAS